MKSANDRKNVGCYIDNESFRLGPIIATQGLPAVIGRQSMTKHADRIEEATWPTTSRSAQVALREYAWKRLKDTPDHVENNSKD